MEKTNLNILCTDQFNDHRKGCPFLTFPGDMPTVGFSYVHQDGQECRFRIGQSGKDGLLITSPF